MGTNIDIQRTLAEAKAKVADLDRQIERLQVEREAYHRIIGGTIALLNLEGEEPQAEKLIDVPRQDIQEMRVPPAPPPRLRGEAALVEAIRELGPSRPVEIRNLIMHRGWIKPDLKDPKAAIATALHRAVDKKRLVRDTDTGLYSLPSDEGGTTSREAEVDAS